eukprot:5525451-Amphidinium_carterae.2
MKGKQHAGYSLLRQQPSAHSVRATANSFLFHVNSHPKARSSLHVYGTLLLLPVVASDARRAPPPGNCAFKS